MFVAKQSLSTLSRLCLPRHRDNSLLCLQGYVTHQCQAAGGQSHCLYESQSVFCWQDVYMVTPLQSQQVACLVP